MSSLIDTAARNFQRGLSALSSAFIKGEIPVYAFAFCERKSLLATLGYIFRLIIRSNLSAAHRQSIVRLWIVACGTNSPQAAE